MIVVALWHFKGSSEALIDDSVADLFDLLVVPQSDETKLLR